MGFDEENLKRGIRPYWWIDIEGIPQRYGHYLPTWNPAAPPSIWANYWYFDGVADYMTTPHNTDFDVEDGGGTLDDSSIMFGFIGTRTSPGIEYLLSKTRGTTDANDGDMRAFLDRNGTDQCKYAHRCAAGHNWKTIAVNDYLPNVRTVYCGQRESNLPALKIHVDDSNGTDLGKNQSTPTKLNWHGTDPIWIGATRNSVLTPQSFFQGRLYFMYWIKGVRMRDVWNTYLLTETPHPTYGTPYPWEWYDQNTYPQCLIRFDRPVAATYTPELQTGPNAPYPFTIVGSPVLNGP